MRKILLLISLLFSTFGSVSAAQILVENVFSDITSNYQYRDELQALYDRGMILPNVSGKFSPDEYLNRDEFVGISMEVICERCIQPHTEQKFIDRYSSEDIYFDIDNTNPYFYCVAEADAQNYVRGYDIGQSCENGINQFGNRPFCPLNRINLEEAVAVLLRNSGIFTIDDNQRIISDIYAGNIIEILGNDVNPTDGDGNPYTFYGYIRKALNYEITQYDTNGNSKTLRLLELDINGNVNPQKSITKEEFLKMAFIALKSNSCNDIIDNNLALSINIWEKTCELGDEDCIISELDDPLDTYDFTPDVEGICEEGIDDPTGYSWRFYNLTNGDEFFHYGMYLDNITLPSSGEWRVYLTVRDNCGNTGQVYSTIVVDVTEFVKHEIDVDIDVFDDDCTGSDVGCVEIEFENEEDDGDDIFDFDGDVSTSCEIGEISYTWTFTHEDGIQRYNFNTEFVDNFDFLSSGVWTILLEVVDGCDQTGSEQMTYIVKKTNDVLSLSADILALPIYGYKDLLVNFEGVVFGGTPPYSYSWDFDNESTGIGKYKDHLFRSVGVFRVLLRVIDVNGLQGTATVLIGVEDGDACLIDSDGDGIFDCDDLCPLIPGENANEGCPILETSCDISCGCQPGYTCSDDNPLTCGAGICEPIFEPRTSCLYTPEVGSIYGNVVCSTCPCDSYLDFLADVRKCDLVFPAITSPDGSQIYSKGDIWQVQ